MNKLIAPLLAVLIAGPAFAAGEDACPFCAAVVEYPSCASSENQALANRAAQVYLGTARGNSMYDAMIQGSMREGVQNVATTSGIVNCMKDAIKAAGTTRGRIVYSVPVSQKNFAPGTSAAPIATTTVTKQISGEIVLR